MSNLYQDLLAMDISKRKIIKAAFAQVNDDILEVCPLTNLVIEKGWFTETEIKRLHASGTWGQTDHPLTMEVLQAVEDRYHMDPNEVALVYAHWDSSTIGLFPEFLKRYMWEYCIK